MKAFTGYLGAYRAAWSQYDATELVKAGHRFSGGILVDQGTADKFLDEQLKPELLAAACKAAGQPLELRMREGYDHGYFFIQTFIASTWTGTRSACASRRDARAAVRNSPLRTVGSGSRYFGASPVDSRARSTTRQTAVALSTGTLDQAMTDAERSAAGGQHVAHPFEPVSHRRRAGAR